ncbi:hypothetical protein GXY_00179 [Novacetimonas hansenii ATCC 23769]|uniref:Uncharacterized protein n=1 Tax=Novacetimonas hansenii ATCC 23769 TaxID=714995 RepID=D5QAA1_NOVHA|nr:hypothetical protein GXY_00179 [Novacetimonas hansenii ATCC 23769]
MMLMEMKLQVLFNLPKPLVYLLKITKHLQMPIA